MASDKSKKGKAGGSGDKPEPTEPIVEPVVKDKRRIDPETGEARAEAQEAAPADGDAEAITDEELQKLIEDAEAQPSEDSSGDSDLLVDLKRVQAEYANYRKRVDRDRYVARELAVAEVIMGILPILDDLDLAHAHGDLEGTPLDIVAQKIRTLFDRYGLVKIGEKGEVFDPNLHEAIAQLPTKDATENIIADVVLPGYQLGERLLRAAKVAVSVPEE